MRIDMMGRRTDRQSQPGGFDQEALLLDNGTFVTGPNSASRAQNALASQVENRRRASRGFYEGERVGRDQKWDAWFGALQAKENYANAAGKRFNVDLMGEGPGSGTGFGRWGAQVDGGPSVSLDGPAGQSDLARAAAAAEAARAEKARRLAESQRQAPATPYTGMFAQPGGRSAEIDQMLEGEEIDASVTDAAKRRAAPVGPARRPTAQRRRAPVNKPAGGVYQAPR